MKKWIRNGTVVTASDTYQADILIEGEKVVAIGSNLDVKDAEMIDATGYYVFPGGIDPHTHLDMPFGGTVTSDNFYTGTKAAAFGGTTSIIDFCLTNKGEPLHSSISTWHEKARGKAVIDYGFHLMVSDANDQVLEELGAVVRNEGITSLKVFMAYKNVLMADDETLFKTLVRAKELGALVQVHAENGDVLDYLIKQAIAKGQTDPVYHAYTRPPEAEGEATGRAIALTALADAQLYVVHVSCAEAVRRIAEAREKGWNVYGETCPQYLVLDITDLQKPGFEGAKYVWSPPLREKWNQDVLWSALKNGILQTVGSDHCSFNFSGQKELGLGDFTKIPNGGPIIEDRMRLLFSEGVAKDKISLNQFVDMTSTKVAKLFGMFPQKGTIAVGSDADIVLFDPTVKRTISVETHHMNVDYNPFEGMVVNGDIISVLSRGSFVIRDQQFVGQAGAGRFVKRSTFARP
ncbi:dihydropyrimidinase [Brevibacillus formosus]|uniref:dihydropyrimidinase n=1 Tax=Brevibacillus TaxID=55080 RepID=UPI000D0E3BC5|nr:MULTISPECIES: dihydropyrimidinase [Brevibacillus]MBG9945335.1 phenylhydantoinase [Brevibacillus formosus]MED1943701.1 dihydropyrimidinase [Brevibacillus formosus]MED1999927.1 dihydropyrimidinase [Brevibacillus formosus]MED2081936.1 dihydropyrimidinase [Brevibacillus formosus]PSK19125.1 dihydropyrimidinase [Brevibacillus sp. NRRL NRS-603]